MKKRKIKIQTVSIWSIIITIAVAIFFIIISAWGHQQFKVLQNTTDQYINCENAAKQLQDGSDYLTEQARLYVMTGEQKYMNLYVKETDVTKRREKAVEDLHKYFDGTETFESLKAALNSSQELSQTEYYAMRLAAEASGTEKMLWPQEVQDAELSAEDSALSAEDKMRRAQDLLCGEQYQDAKTVIIDNVNDCMNSLISQTQNRQGRANSIFSDMYRKMEVGIILLVVLMLLMSFMVRKLIVGPLKYYNKSIRQGEIFPVVGAAELQMLAETYNQVYNENQEIQKLIKHQAEHDALTNILNRGSFEKIHGIYEKGESPYALILVDVDVFKSVNDNYGHAVGDKILKKVADLLKTTFRSIDYICRIGGDEFSVIMVEMTSDLQYTIQEKIDFINEQLAHPNPEEGVPAVSLSVGVAFSDRKNPGDSIFKDADKALYYVKEHGRGGCSFY